MEQAFPSSVTDASVASSSYSSPVPLPSSPAWSSHQWRYDVFVSFCGKDTRTKFKTHLYNVLEQVGIDHYDDEDGSERGMVVSEMLREAIQHSRVALVVLSRNYARSRWCLDELTEIVECSNKFRGQHAVHPIFYEIDPADVRKQEGQFGEIFTRCALEHPDKKEEWKRSLVVIGNLSGWHLTDDKDEREFIDKIVRQLSDQSFYERTSYFVEYPVVHDDIEKVITSLKMMTSQAVRTIGLYGTKGIGKTTMAKIICHRLSDAFGYVKVFETVQDENIREVMTRRRHNILLVLDNVDEIMVSHVKKLLGECKRLRLGSRIIIISREEKILRDLGVYERYMVSGFGAEESIRLFEHHAFSGGGNGTPRGFEKVSKHLLHYCGGHPLWIKIMGDVLSQKPQLEQWNEILENLVITPYLDSAGIHTESSYPSYPLRVGPFGGLHGGVPFDDDTYTGIRRISTCVSWKVETLTVDYDFRGCLVRVRHGKTEHNHSKTYTVELGFPDEYLVSMSGSVIKSLVQSVKFRSNKNVYGPFGETNGNNYNVTTESKETGREMIVGFLGRSGSYIDSIGANFGPIEHPYPFKEMGPFGGQGGKEWNHGMHTDVRQLKVGILNSVITSIIVLYDDNGRPVGPFKQGDTNEGLIHTITLDFPYEYLTSISGYIVEDSEKTIIQSLNFHSNINKIYKFGKEPEDNGVETMGRHFSCPSSNGKIVGFFGRSTPGHLESIGVILEPVSHIYPLKNLGPIGGDQGRDWDDEVHEHIMKITIRSGLVIDSIMFIYDNDGVHAESVRHGGSGGEETHVIELCYPTEQITAVSGYFGDFDGVTVIGSLMFHSTRRTYVPYGHFLGGTFFVFPPTIGKIVGFFGKSDKYLNSIGVHMKLHSRKDYPFRSVGLLGCGGGDVWDDGEHNDVCQIEVVVRADEEVIQSVQFGYKSNGSYEQSCVHGSNTGRRHLVKLGYPQEYLTSVSGYFEDDSPCGIRSLSFYSNERVLGPYGNEKGRYFSFPVTGGKIIGFYGKCSASNLNSIGAYFQPVIDLYPLKVVGPFGGSGGKPFEDRGFTGVRKIHIASGRVINHLFFEYDKKGHPVVSDGYQTSHGQTGHKTIKLDYPTEYLTSIFGYIRTNQNPVTVGSLTFQSNLRRYGPYGDEEGQFFWFPSTGGKIIGFHGRFGGMLDSVGVYMEPVYHTSPPKSISVGGNGGIPWDDGCYTDVRQIKILIGSVIESIVIEYDNNGWPIQCSQHGETSGWESNTGENTGSWNITSLRKVLRRFYGRLQEPKWFAVRLDFPREYLVSLSGYTGKEVTGEEVVQSLTVTSNKRIYGPFGTRKGSRFQLPEGSDGRIIGLYGRSESYLHAIGVHLEPYLHAIRDCRVFR